jgi:CDP-diacylglycerol--glycerol-3-phosphate 3-phosphatidyltransferase
MVPLDRACRRAIVVGLVAILAASATVGWLVSPGAGGMFAACSLPSWGWVAGALARARLYDDRTDTLGWATHLTLLRGLLVSLVAGFALMDHGGVMAWWPGLLYTAAVLTDRYDGVVARRAGQVTDLGARLDVAMDGLGLLVAPLVAVIWKRLPPWYLLVGAAYYFFHGGIALRRRWGLAVHPDRLRRSRVTRFFAGAQMGLVAVALLPVLNARVNILAATLLMLPTLGLFARDWLVVVGWLVPAVTPANGRQVDRLHRSNQPVSREESLAR